MRYTSRAAIAAFALAAIATVALAQTPRDSSPASNSPALLRIIHMDVGQGDGTVIITPGGKVVLIDDGDRGNTSAPVAQLKALGVTHVDYHFASHYHDDHIGAISQILKSGIVIDAGWDRGESYKTKTFSMYVNALGDRRHTITKNQIFILDENSAHPVTIKCVDLNGAGIPSDDENAMCVVLKLTYGEFDESFGGDLTEGSEAVVGREMGRIEAYKVHHHGADNASSDAWLDATAPQVAVIQCGDKNTYGHPTSGALCRLHAHRVRTYWNERGAGGEPDARWDHVANGWIEIDATWEPGGLDTVKGNGFTDTFANSGAAGLAVQAKPAIPPVAPIPPVPSKGQDRQPSDPAPSQPRAETPPSPPVTVYVTKTKGKYHFEGCGSLKNHDSTPMSLDEAKKESLVACGCKHCVQAAELLAKSAPAVPRPQEKPEARPEQPVPPVEPEQPPSPSAKLEEKGPEVEARRLLNFAKSFEEKMPDEAIKKYEELRSKYAGTDAAKEGETRYKDLMERLRKQADQGR